MTQKASAPLAKGPPSTAARLATKAAQLTGLLQRKGGQSADQLVAALGWQPHSVRAAISGLCKQGVNVERFARDGHTRYCISSPTSRS